MRPLLLACSLLTCCAPDGGSPASTPPPAPAPAPSPSSPAPTRERTTAAPAPASAAEPAAPARRCLPVVAAACGCVYSCGLGVEAAPGRWSVEHEHWAPLAVTARVDRWCVDGRCTEAFFGELPCSAICSPRPAEPLCRLADDRCVLAMPAVDARPAAKPSDAWPFVAWDRAEAFAFNHVPYGPGAPLRVYDATHGWSEKIVERRSITAAQAERAVGWVRETGGDVEVSKCPFPRHAVVLYAGDVPVGTINVCFECGDILVWPALDPAIADDPSPAALRRREKAYKKKLAAYDRVFPRWQGFFRDEVGFPLTPPKRP